VFEYLLADPVDDPKRFAIMNADGSGRRDIPLAPPPRTVMGGFAFVREDPTFAADGQRVLYTRHWNGVPVGWVEIWSAAIDGSDDRRIGTGYSARISPDGRRVAYVRSRSADGVSGSTWLMSTRTGKPTRQLWPGPAWSIDWSPDGRHIVFTANPRASDDPFDVYVIRSNGTGLRRLTSTPGTFETEAVWSPDGQLLAAVRQVQRPLPDDDWALAQSIWLMRADGTAQRRIRGPWRHRESENRGAVRISWQPLPRRWYIPHLHRAGRYQDVR
jgi:Tol biopolymer transport system component